jgi:hypothetical protein
MRKLFTLFYLAVCFVCQSQNIGIGTLNPTKAKLEVFGAFGSSNTSAAFGTDGKGISIQRNPPIIGINQYNDSNTGLGKFMAFGDAFTLHLDPAGGELNINYLGVGSNDNPVLNANTLSLISFKNTGSVYLGSKLNVVSSLFLKKNYDFLSGLAQFNGTIFHTKFYEGIDENVRINGGKANSVVSLNDVSGGKILINGATTIQNTADPPLVYNAISTGAISLKVNGAIAFTKNVRFQVCNNGTFQVGDNSYITVTRSGCNNATGLFLSDGITDGQILIIQAEGNNDFTVYNSGNIICLSNIQMGGGDILMLIWHSNLGKWIKMSYSNN